MDLLHVYDILFKAFGPQHWWPAKTPFEMMVGAILTQNTAWLNVEKALKNFDGKLSPEFILESTTEDIAEIIRTSGFFNQKAVRLKKLAEWFAGYNCNIDRIRAIDSEIMRKELLSLPGVGRETADSIMLYALKHPYFVIDAYTRRIFSRIGFMLSDDYEGIRNYFESNLPHNAPLFNEYHALIVYLAKFYCRKNPECEHCPLLNCCNSAEIVTRS